MSSVRVIQAGRMKPARSLLAKRFYLYMCLPIVAAVVYGFSFTVDRNIIHPAIPRPHLLYIHAAVMVGWLLFFAFQSVLVQTRRTRWHRTLGWFGIALAAAVFVIGLSTAVVMTRFDLRMLHQDSADYDMIIPLWDMVCFSSAVGWAVWYRKKPEYHRRLMFVATCAITAAGWGRFPQSLFPPQYFYGGVDLLILLGVVSDWWRSRSIHVVYKAVLPLFLAGQAIVSWTSFGHLAYWRPIARAIIRL